MDIVELKKELNKIGVNPNRYSLNGSLDWDKIILYKNYSKWEVFYLDERGERNDEKIFNSEEDACLFIYKCFLEMKTFEKQHGING
jgi:hypothetical protein